MRVRYRFYEVDCVGGHFARTFRPHEFLVKVVYNRFYTNTKRHAIKRVEKYLKEIQHEHVRIVSVRRVRYGHFFQRYKWYWKLKTLRLEIKKEIIDNLRSKVSLLVSLFIHKLK